MTRSSQIQGITIELVIANTTSEINRATKHHLTLPTAMTIQQLRSWLNVQTSDDLLLIAKAFGEAVGFGLFGKVIPADTPLKDNDRLELLGPLLADPKQARRQRVQASRLEKASKGQFDRWTRNR
jgi:putative ubiquitin-RnfH superfamily antitoxin RatB of RatAB toxin-antitoxin module